MLMHGRDVMLPKMLRRSDTDAAAICLRYTEGPRPNRPHASSVCLSPPPFFPPRRVRTPSPVSPRVAQSFRVPEGTRAAERHAVKMRSSRMRERR